MAVATDYKISTAEINAVHVEAQPTILQGTATQNKQVFDKYSDMIAGKHNDLCDFIAVGLAPNIDGEVLVAFAEDGWTPDN